MQGHVKMVEYIFSAMMQDYYGCYVRHLYQSIKTCGLVIEKVKKGDAGEWGCKMLVQDENFDFHPLEKDIDIRVKGGRYDANNLQDPSFYDQEGSGSGNGEEPDIKGQ